ncbi:MFS transporter [Mesorhizobium sp. VK4C]|uniref:MFS transporter n=1 Tax=Mesorhizobium captivum TaxID=3072319 RepID=UPI002A24AF9A|nr:MFS transporter [Mesorhizobium sp. VK4C]MDX8500912.1 MFS transporter [Mesorhizobium sp. VK4C]
MKNPVTILSDSPAFRFVLIMGIVNLFGDWTYEGGASVNGPFLGTLGANAAAVSIIAGAGEFLGYSMRSVAGYIADKTGRYWLITFIGYAINLLAVPAMAIAGSWQIAAALVLAERVGRAMRKPTVEAMLSYTTGKHGRGWVYGLNTALDETGATIGPLFVALVLLLRGSYETAYALLLVSALLALASLSVARFGFPLPSRLEEGRTAPATGFTSSYWLYMFAGAFFAAGLMSFELISFHLSRAGIVAGHWIPVLLAFSTGCGVVASLVFGRLYDRIGLPVVLVAVCLSSLFAPFVFLGGFFLVLVGMVLWGIGYATQDTLLKVLIASVLPEGRRNLAFGLFYVGYGVGWLLGSVATGLLYEQSLVALVVFAVAVQLASLPLFVIANRL